MPDVTAVTPRLDGAQPPPRLGFHAAAPADARVVSFSSVAGSVLECVDPTAFSRFLAGFLVDEDDPFSFTEGDHWVWRRGVDSSGYGKCKFTVCNVCDRCVSRRAAALAMGARWDRSVSLRAHQVMWVLHWGPVLPGYELNHVCALRRCANPRTDGFGRFCHVELSTRAANMADMVGRRRAAGDVW